MRVVGLHAFCSVKGGVGKSTLAVVTASLLAQRGRVPVVVDADMLGASLADGLRLCAPAVATKGDGTLDLEASPTGRWLSLGETRRLRGERAFWLEERPGDSAELGSPPPPPYLNDALDYAVPDAARECAVAALLWKHERGDGVLYLPSSPLRLDAARAAPYALGTSGEFQWVRRLSWVLDGLLDQRPDITDLVLDLPPGTWGFAHEILVLLGQLDRGENLPQGYPRWSSVYQWRVNPFIVTSRDRNDRVLAMEYFISTRLHVPRLVPICNRVYLAPRVVLDEVRSDLPEPVRALGFEEKLRFVPELRRTLGEMFVHGDVAVEQAEELSRVLRLEEPQD